MGHNYLQSVMVERALSQSAINFKRCCMSLLPNDLAVHNFQQSNSALSPPQALATIESHPLEFTATGSEYFRIWIVNLLLILVTVGIYLPWAKVRKLKYFYSNTRVDKHALDFHGEPKKMLRGTLIVGVFFMVYSQAARLAPLAGVVALLALLAIWPLLFRASMKFRLANTSWRGMRFRFVDTGLLEPYLCLVPPMALLLIPSVLVGFGGGTAGPKSTLSDAAGVAIGLIFLGFIALLPYFFWRIKRYQHNHYAWGPLQSEYRSGAASTYKVFGSTILVVLLLATVFGVSVAVLMPALFKGGLKNSGINGAWALLSLLPLVFLFLISINIAPRAFFTTRMQNLLWSRTGNRFFRFKSELTARSYILLQFKNYFLILITLGLYWPFAVVASKRMQIEAVSLRSRLSLDALTDVARKHENDAAGDMAADLFGMDIGM
jgi:uncharacterized membrane protein YjgN (DUF898 family)